MGRRRLCMREDAEVRKGSHLFPGPYDVKDKVVRPRAFAKCSKGHCIHLHTPPTPHLSCLLQHGMRQTVSKIGLTIVVGLLKFRVQR
jgi:hypothetical protein